MIKLVWLAMVALVGAPQAHAQVSIDVAKITCEQFVGFKVADPKMIAVWLSGYYNGKRTNTVIDPQALERDADKVKDYCWSNFDQTVMRAAEQTLGAGK